MISYQRYEMAFEPQWLKADLGVDLCDRQCEDLIVMDNPGNAGRLAGLGRKAATVQVLPAHFRSVFDI
jgi:hypothetical protein